MTMPWAATAVSRISGEYSIDDDDDGVMMVDDNDVNDYDVDDLR